MRRRYPRTKPIRCALCLQGLDVPNPDCPRCGDQTLESVERAGKTAEMRVAMKEQD